MSDGAQSLRIDFATEAAFRGEYVGNISNGGVFVATNAGFAVRDPVCVEVVLQWCGRSVLLDGEVVAVVAPEMAGPEGSPGVAVQFALRASDLRERFGPVLEQIDAAAKEKSGPGNRVASRARVRVPVLVRTTDGREIEGRSRDLSTTGALIGMRGRPPESGEVVQLAIPNPSSGEELEVHGTVMRHVPLPGNRTGIGVRFEIPPGDVDGAGGFLRELQVSERSRRLGGITGPIDEIGIENVLQMFGTCSAEGTLTLFHGDDEATVVFQHSMLRGVKLGETYGRKALSRLLAWRSGTFEFSALARAELEHGDPVPLDAAVLDAFRLRDESNRAVPGALSVAAKLQVDREKLAAAGAELSQTEEAILDLAAVEMSVGKVIDVIPEPDEEIRQQLVSLIERGLIRLID